MSYLYSYEIQGYVTGTSKASGDCLKYIRPQSQLEPSQCQESNDVHIYKVQKALGNNSFEQNYSTEYDTLI